MKRCDLYEKNTFVLFRTLKLNSIKIEDYNFDIMNKIR